MHNKASLGNAFTVATGIHKGADRKHSLDQVRDYARTFLKTREIKLNEQGFDCPAAKVLIDETGEYKLHIFDQDRGFIPDDTADEPIVYLNAAHPA